MTFEFVPADEVLKIRGRVSHPIIDGDGHHLEYLPLVQDLLRDVADAAVERRFKPFAEAWTHVSSATAADYGSDRTSGISGFQPVRTFWTSPAVNTLDWATATLPGLLYRRLPEMGLDFALLYPTLGLIPLGCPDAELRQALARALNHYYAEVYDGYRDRLEPVAVIPMFTPEEAIAELTYAVEVLGLKAVTMSSIIPRRTTSPATFGGIEIIGHGNATDYDPVWSKCTELGVTPTFHMTGIGWGARCSTSNYVYNHLGSFAAAGEAACRSLILGGVPMRFPDLRFAFLEGGAAWAGQLYADLVSHWKKRNRHAVQRFDPSRLDLALAGELFDRFADGSIRDRKGRLAEAVLARSGESLETSDSVDDFAESLIECEDDVTAIYARQLYFGCEADDPFNAIAFDRRILPGGLRLNAIFGSDIGHWDVPEMRAVLLEAWELVEDFHLSEQEFSDFTCGNIIRMLTAGNPKFFDGTAITDVVRTIDL